MKSETNLIIRILCVVTLCSYVQIAFSQEIIPVINYYQGNKEIKETSHKFELSTIIDSNNVKWQFTVKEKPYQNSIEYICTWRLLKGIANSVSVGIEIPFTKWDINNYVFVPSVVYNGNRFDIKKMAYPPYWYDKAEWRIDMPTTTTDVPTLGKNRDRGRIELSTGNTATPLMAFHSSSDKKGWMIQTKQGNNQGNYGYFITEDKLKNSAKFAIKSPCVREQRATGGGFAESEDKAANLKEGDVITLSFRVSSFKAKDVSDLMAYYMQERKIYSGASSTNAVMPFSEMWRVMNDMYQKNRWSEDLGIYCLKKPGSTDAWNQIWQLGWCGGGQVTLPFLLNGTDEEFDRAVRNLDVIFTKTQAPSGFYNAYGNGKEFKSFGFGEAFKYNETFVRSQGDFLYMGLKQIAHTEKTTKRVNGKWRASIRKQADAFANVWNIYGQFGQFVDVNTGGICIGGSTAGAIVPAGLALAYKLFDEKRYLKIAEESAEKYYRDYVQQGYTTGGPGEILSTPDSESAFGLFETYIVLHEVTGSDKWLTYAKELLPICASWVVSYNYDFPKHSIMHQIGAKSVGSVWASVANKHSSPGICTWSGESLLKYFRATGDVLAMDLLVDIANGFPQYVSHEDRPIGNMESGGSCERVNISDWEGENAIGGNIFASCSWVETAGLLTAVEIPSIYVQSDREYVAVLDHVEVHKTKDENGLFAIHVKNPTKYLARLKVYIENSSEAKEEHFCFSSNNVKIIELQPNQSKTVSIE